MTAATTLPAANAPDGYRIQAKESGFAQMIGPIFQRVGEDGRQSLGFRIEAKHLNNSGSLHGGMIQGFADMAWGRVISTERSINWVTIRLVCDFLAGANLGEFIEGAGEIAGEADGIFTVRGRIWTGERTLAVGTGLFKGFQAREARPGERAYRG